MKISALAKAKRIFHANGKEKKAGAVRKDEKVYYIMTNQSIQEEDITFVKIYVPDIGEHKYIKPILTEIKGERDNNTKTVGDFNGEGNGTHSSTLAWKIPWMEEPCRLQSMGSRRIGHD